MKMKFYTFVIGLFLMQISFAQETTTVKDTLNPVLPVTKTEAELKAEKEKLKAEQKAQKEKEKALKAEEKAKKQAEKAEQQAKKAEEKARKAEEKAKKTAQKNKQNLAKAKQEVLKIETQIKKKENELAREQNKYNMKVAKGSLSPNDEAKYKGKILKKQQDINNLQLKLIKAQGKVNKYSDR